MNVKDIIAGAIETYHADVSAYYDARSDMSEDALVLPWPDPLERYVLDALAAADLVVVACPPGSRVVVSRTPKPCQRCDSRGTTCATKGCNGHRCSACGGSGVVEATTIHGLEPFGYRCMWEGCDTYLCDGVHYEGSKRAPVVMEVESWALVALPEETPQ